MSQNALKLLSLSSAIFKRNERPPSFSSSGLHSICLLSIIIIIIMIIIVFFFPAASHYLGWLLRSSWIGSSVGLCSVEGSSRKFDNATMPDPEFARISYRGQNTELHESLFQKYLNNLIWLTWYFSTLALPIKRLHIRPGDFFSLPLTRILVWRRATKYLRRLHVSHRRSLPGSFQRVNLIGQWLLNSALEALTGKTCASASSRELARAADMGNLCEKSLGSAGRVSFFSTSSMTHLWTDLAVIYSCHSRLHFIDLAFLHAL